MHFDPQESRKAHSQTDEGPVAALRHSPSCSPVAPGAARATPTAVPVQGVERRQPFPFGDAPDHPLRARRHLSPISKRILRQIANDDWAHNRRPIPEQPTLREGLLPIALGLLAAFLVGALIAYAQSQGWIAQ